MKINKLLVFLIVLLFFTLIYLTISEQESEKVSSPSLLMNYINEFQSLFSESAKLKIELDNKNKELNKKLEKLKFYNLYIKVFNLFKGIVPISLPFFLITLPILLSLLGYVIFIFLKRQRVAWFFTKESLTRLIWFIHPKTEKIITYTLSIPKHICILLLVFLIIGIVNLFIKVYIPSLPEPVVFESASPVLKEPTTIVESKKETEFVEMALTSKELLERTYKMLISNRDNIGKKIYLPQLPQFSRIYLRSISQVVVGEPEYSYILGAISSELGYDNTMEFFNKYLSLLSEQREIIKYHLLTLGTCLFFLENNQIEKVRNFIKNNPGWSEDVSDYLKLAKESSKSDILALSEEILDVGLIQFDDKRESYFLLLEERFKTYNKDKQKSVLEAYAIRHKDDFSDCLDSANFCYHHDLTELSSRFLERCFDLARNITELEKILPLSLEVHNLSKISNKLEFFVINNKGHIMDVLNISKINIQLEKQKELGEEISLGTLVAIFYAYSGKENKSAEMIKKVLLQTSLSFPYSSKRTLYDIYCALSLCDKIKNEKLLSEIKNSVEERAKKDIRTLKIHIQEMQNTIVILKKEIVITKIKVFLSSVLKWVGIVMFILPFVMAGIGSWISCGAIPDLKFLTFFIRFTELLGFQYCIMIIYIPLGLILIWLAQFDRLFFAPNEYVRQIMASRNYRLLG